MKEDSLHQRLNNLAVPKASESARSRARHRALIAFEQRDFDVSKPVANNAHVLNWRYVVALIGLGLIASFFFHRPHAAKENLAYDRQILGQMEKLFPNQVDSVVEENGKIDLSVTQTSTVGSDQPVLVVFRKNAQSIRVLSYSGHHVCVALGKEHRCFDILATPSGGVILEADDKVWLNSERPVVAGYSIHAQTLEASL
jgi:hypothetical protein